MGVSEAPTLHQRLAAIQADIAPIEPTGQNEYKKPALSIGDVEEALRPLFAEHGVLTRWRRKELERIEPRLWRAVLICRMTNTDDHEDRFEEEWEDVGSNPSAAYSFTRKGYYKAVFHLADASDDQITAEAPTPRQQRQAAAPKEQKKPLTLAQQIAMICNKLGIERSHLIKAVTGKEHGRDLTREEAFEVLMQARAIRDGTRRIIGADGEYMVVLADLVNPSQVSLPVDGATA